MKTLKPLALPESIDYPALCQVEKTRKLTNGGFACVAALYFMGQRGAYITVVAETRGRAIRGASDFIQSGQRALIDPSFAAGMRNSAAQSESRLRAMGG